MYSKKEKQTLTGSSVLNFTPPRIHSGKTTYIDFYALDPATNTMRRKKYMLDKYRSKKELDMMATAMISSLFEKLLRGWSPFVAEKPVINSGVQLTECAAAYCDYIARLQGKDAFRPKTVRDNSSRMKIFLDYLNEYHLSTLCVSNFNTTLVNDFLEYVLFERDTSVRNRNNYRYTMSSFGNYLVSHNHLEVNPVNDSVPIMREGAKIREALSTKDLLRLKEYLLAHDKQLLLAVYMLYYTAIRPTEMTFLKLKDFNIKEQSVFVSGKFSKNKRDGKVALHDNVIKLMIDLEVFKYPNGYFLFGDDLLPSEEQTTAHTFRKRWNKARAALKFPACYQFYSLKDTGLRDLIAKEGVIVARDQARHTDVSTTNKYLVSKSLTVHDEAKHYDGAL